MRNGKGEASVATLVAAAAAPRTAHLMRKGKGEASVVTLVAAAAAQRTAHLMRKGKSESRRGFTFVELMVVVTIIVILISMAIPTLTRSITRAKESVLHQNLYTLRTVLDNYCYDKGKCPQGLQDLVSEGYLRAIPADPMNNYSNDWNTVLEDASQSVNQQEPGIWDVHSKSDKSSLDGKPYSEW